MEKPPQATRRQSRPLLLLLTSPLLCLRQPPPRLPSPCFPPNHDLFIHLPRWLSVAFFRHAQDLTLDLGGTADPIPFDFPNSLVRLTLIGLRIIIPPSTFVNLSSLEALNLYYIAITDSDLEMVIRGCYLLRSLDIRRCLGLKNVVIPGMGLWLENVKVVDCYGMAELSIETRSLRRLHYCGRFLSKFYFEWLWKLELENVFASCGGMGLMYGALDFKLDVLPVTNWLTVFGGFSRVKGLTLCSLSLRYIAASGDFHKFPCLRELQLLMMTMTKSNLMDICNFFRLCFPSGLEKLFIEFPRNIGSPFEKFSNDVEEQPLAGALTNLKIIEINRFIGYRNHMLLAKILLWKAICLESLFIVVLQVLVRESTVCTGDYQSFVLHFLHLELDLMVKSSENARIVIAEHDDHRERYLSSCRPLL